MLKFKEKKCFKGPLLFSCSFVSNSETPWTVAHQAPLSMGSGMNPGVNCHFLLQPYSILVLFVPRLLRLRHVPALNSPSFISRQHSSKPPNPM